MARKRKGIPGVSFSWRRAIGLSAAQGRLSRKIGIPLSRSGRQRKVGRAMGCAIPFFIMVSAFFLMIIGFIAPAHAIAERIPQFRNYPSGPIYNGPHSQPDLTSRENYNYRTRLRAAAAQPANFAGHYRLETWGCGTECVTGAIVDLVTGRVTFFPFSICCSVKIADDNFNPVEFRQYSRLIVFSGLRNEEPPDAAHFYEFTRGGFTYITSTKPFDDSRRSAAQTRSDDQPAPATNQTQVGGTDHGCASIPNPTDRLACYDSGGRLAASAMGPATAINRSVDEKNVQPSRGNKAQTEEIIGPSNGEQDFMTEVERARAAYAAGANDMQKGAARPNRARALCGVLPTGRAARWVGEIATLSSNSDGKGVLEIKIDKNIIVGTWNNSLSDLGDRTLIDPSSDIFKKASALSKGDRVVFSGNFVRSEVDCFRESSMTLNGSITEPKFLMQFTDIAPLR